ncbi:MAG: FAD-dependent oxidoreductase [Beijerinckiaceae bacterium]|jgi:2-polyprenyl-6-methoxyphenol hydroxylase-like FAD-dependent oxidoreductase|nr:FAD-dependent oxidoreductase [Beijerinckiaceae bacterium]
MTSYVPPPAQTSVFITGCGPCGMMLANELGRRGISTIIADTKDNTVYNPQANATQARSMEHYRRHGFADEIRAMGMPANFPPDIAYFTRLAGYELARFEMPRAMDAKQVIRGLSGSWSAAELPHRVSQKYVEQVLLKHARKYSSNTVHFKTRLVSFTDHGTHVDCLTEPLDGGPQTLTRAQYLVGADGARSTVRKGLGVNLSGESGVQREFMGGRMYAIYLRCPDYYAAMPNNRAWMNVTVNADQRAFMTSINGADEFSFHFQLKPGQDEELITEEEAKRQVYLGWGKELPIEIMSRVSWTAGYTLVADTMRSGRVLIGGDAAHLFTPAGGMGYNTAIEDAVNMGWKLAAMVRGQGGDTLLQSYDTERRAIALRNTAYARTLADSLGGFVATPELEQETPAGEAARKTAGDYYNNHARIEFNIPGFTLGARYDGSPVIVSDGTAPPPDGPNIYHPSACPGGRAPHLWLDDGRSLYDAFNLEWTLLRMDASADTSGYEAAFAQAGIDLQVLDLPISQLRDLYEADLALIRPDQVVAWRSNGKAWRSNGKGSDPQALVAAVLGQA